MNSECLRLADQLHRAFEGDAWHGPPLKTLLEDVSAAHAHAHPVNGAHSIWELVLHINSWTHVALEAMDGTPMPKPLPDERNFPPIPDKSDRAWQQATKQVLETGVKLRQAVEKFNDTRLEETVPGRKYNFYVLLHGVVQHTLYHGGQIALLRKSG